MKKYGIAAVYGSRLFPVRVAITRSGKFRGYYKSGAYSSWFHIVKCGHKETAEKLANKIKVNTLKGFNPTLKGLDLKVVELSGRDLTEAVKRIFGSSF